MIPQLFRPIKGEEWRPVNDGWVYDVSNLGRIRSKARARFGSCILRDSPDPAGYRFVILAGKGFRVHQLVARAFVPNPDGKPEVNHKDLNKANNVPSNLEWVTHRENLAHARARLGNWSAGVKHRTVPIIRVSLDGTERVRFPSIRAAVDDLNRLIVAAGGDPKPYAAMAGNICHARNRPNAESYRFRWRSIRFKG